MTIVTESTFTATLLADLAQQHRRVLGVIDGLDDATLRRPVLPSGWSVLSMINHLTGGARFWLITVMRGQPDTDAVETDDFALPAGLSAEAIVDTFRRETEAAVAAVRDLPLDAPPGWWPEGWWGGWRLHNLGEILVHLLVETACHAGHLDAARELIDGRTWDYSTDRLAADVDTV
jgi:uncharacterized damage-inducible protein DinB